MADEPVDRDADRLARAIGKAEAQARHTRQTARICKKCGKSMLGWPGRSVHYSCDPAHPLAGMRCNCAPGCSDTHWGNGPTPCAPECEPCKIMRGKPLRGRKG